jgi:hypothetical protein
LKITRVGSYSEDGIEKLAVWGDVDLNNELNLANDQSIQDFNEPFVHLFAVLIFEAPILIESGSTRTFFITLDISSNTGEFSTLGLKLEGSGSVSVKNGFVSIISTQVEAGAGKLSYIGRPPSNQIVIDGAFGDWEGVTFGSKKDGDNEPVTNPNIDLTEFGLTYTDQDLSFYCSVVGSMMGGTNILAGPVYLSLKPPDEPEPQLEPPDIVPAPPGEMPLLPELIGEDTVCIFIDTDNLTNTGYQFSADQHIPNLGADHLIKISGKNGVVRSSGYYSFNGKHLQDWSWKFLGNVKVGTDNYQLETQINFKLLGVGDGEAISVGFYAHDWNNQSHDHSSENLIVRTSDFSMFGYYNETDSRGDYVLIEIDDETRIELLIEKYEIEIVESYASFVMANVTYSQQLQMQKQGFTTSIRRLNERTILNLNGYRFDTRQGRPALPVELTLGSYPPETNGMYIIQFIGPVKQTWLNEIDNGPIFSNLRTRSCRMSKVVRLE